MQGVNEYKHNGIHVMRIHYSADPDRRGSCTADCFRCNKRDTCQEWKARESRGYTERQWEKEQEINFTVKMGKAWFPEFRHEFHVAKEPLKPLPGKTIVRAWDYGLTPATLFTQYGPKGELLVLREIQSTDCGITAHGKVIQAVSGEYVGHSFADIGDPAGRQRAQTDEQSCADILRDKYDIHVQDGPVSAVKRWEAVRSRLTTTTDTGGPMLLIDPSCAWLIGGFTGGYCRKKVGDVYLEEPEKNMYSHTQDGLGYLCAGNAGTASKWDSSKNRKGGQL
jgi:hypothetical protein